MEKDSIFKFKKPAKKTVGDFDADDKQEWCLLVKPQIGDVTLFIHFHKLWCVTEVPPVMGKDEDGNDIIEEPGVEKMPVCNVYFGFVKDDKFVVERQQTFKERVDELVHKTLNKNIQNFLDQGYTKDYNNYKLDEPIVPNYYGHKKEDKPGFLSGILGNKKPHVLLKNMMQSVSLGKNSNSQNSQNP